MILFALKSENRDTRDAMYKDTQTATNAAKVFLTCEEALPWHTGYAYMGHTLRKKGKVWLLVVLAARDGIRVVSFWEGDSPTQCAQAFAFTAVYGDIDWKRDAYS